MQVGTLLNRGYRIDNLLGEGGMGVVYTRSEGKSRLTQTGMIAGTVA